MFEETVPDPVEGVKVVSVTETPTPPNEPVIVVKKGVKGVAEGIAVVVISVAVSALDPLVTEKLGHIPALGGIVAALSLGGWRAFTTWWKHRHKQEEEDA